MGSARLRLQGASGWVGEGSHLVDPVSLPNSRAPTGPSGALTFFPWAAPMARSGHQAWVGLRGQAGGPSCWCGFQELEPEGFPGPGPLVLSRLIFLRHKGDFHSCSEAWSSLDRLRVIALDRGALCPHVAYMPSWRFCGSPPGPLPLLGRETEAAGSWEKQSSPLTVRPAA